jgi:hypothetical protein
VETGRAIATQYTLLITSENIFLHEFLNRNKCMFNLGPNFEYSRVIDIQADYSGDIFDLFVAIDARR